MWLLSTVRAELHEFPNPRNIPPYATLSHIIDGKEESFNDLKRLHKECASDGQIPRDLVSEKIRESCELAFRDNLHWIWIYPCCMDESSQAERKEVINSMFSIYEHSRVCYAYIRTMYANRPVPHDSGQFFTLAWLGESWTLQALLFVSCDWKVLGDRSQFAEPLAIAIEVSKDVLLLNAKVADARVSRRMSWAKGQRSALPEGHAYSLLGIFSVRLRLDYGEGGPTAFYRLQKEIMKTLPDNTLFTWGDGTNNATKVLSNRPLSSTASEGSCTYHSDPCAYLFTPSPAPFGSLYVKSSAFMTAQDNPSVSPSPFNNMGIINDISYVRPDEH